MKLLTWNINHGGGSRINEITKSLTYHQADIIILTEFRHNKTGEQLCQFLDNDFWRYHESSKPSPRINGILTAAKIPFKVCIHKQVNPSQKGRWMEVEFDNFGLFAVYLEPNLSGKKRYHKKNEFRLFWQSILKIARAKVDSPYIFVGDFNTGKHYIDEKGATFYGSEYIDEMESIGFTDAWRYLHPKEREYTWFSHKGNGFRIDRIFLSPKIKEKLLDTYHSHVERENRISDHSVLIATLNDY